MARSTKGRLGGAARHRMLVVLAGTAIIALCPGAVRGGVAADQVTASVQADTFANAAAPTRNYGASSLLRIDGTRRITYLRFALSGLASPVSAATLRVYMQKARTTSFDVRRVADNSWAESSLTYENAPQPSPTVVGSSGSVSSSGWVSVDVTAVVTGNGTYSFALTGANDLSLMSRERGPARAAQLVVETRAPSDTTPPSVPPNLQRAGSTATNVSLTWSASTDDVGIAGYRVYRDSTLLASTGQTGYTAEGLSCGVDYTFAVEAYDAAGNTSEPATVTASTSACSDTTPPTAPTNLAVTGSSPSSVWLGWSPSTDDVGVAGYDVYVDAAKVGRTSGTNHTFEGLACGMAYTFGVEAYDAAGNVSDRATYRSSTSDCPTGPRTYYVDSLGGNDANAGTSESTAWRTIARASSAPLAPGDQLLFKRGAAWAGSLTIAASGTSSSPITIGAFGSGNLPVIGGGSATSCVVVSGSYVVLRELHADDCAWAGIEISGSSNRLERSLVTDNAAGVHVKSGAVGNAVVDNDIVDNNKMAVLTASPTDDDWGAFGVLLSGDATDVSGNRISGSDAFSYDYGRDGAAIEVSGGRNSDVHGNVAVDNHDFAELRDSRAADNTLAYNLVRSSLAGSTFLITRGAGSSSGPVLDTRAYNNTVYLTGASSQGFVCRPGCSPDVLTMRNNIIQAVWKVGDADAPFDEDNDVFFGGVLQFTKGASSKVADPRFVNPSTLAFQLQAQSPAVDLGVGMGYTKDLDGDPVPVDGDGDGVAAPDAGSYERAAGGAGSDTTPPTAPTDLSASAATATSVAVSWTASTDNVGVAGYRVYRNGLLLDSTAQTTYSLSGLTCATAYTVEIEAYDAAGNVSTRSGVTASTSACSDTTPPTDPQLLIVTASTQTSITLSWMASIDNVGVTGYGLYRNGTLVGTTALTTHSFAGLTCGTGYTLAVDAYDAAGNRSAKVSVTAASGPCSDTSPPTAPSNLQVTASTATSLSSSWTASTDNVGVTGYTVYANGATVGTTTGTSYVVSSLSCGTSYTLGVEAFDGAGNVSGRTSLTTATAPCQSGGQIRWRFAYSNRADQNLATTYGYNLIDVSTKSEADATPTGTQGQLWLYDYDNTTCTWEKDDAYVTNIVSATANDPKVAGYYFSNEPDPFACPNAPQQHKARHALIKSLAPTKYTLVGIDANWRSHFDAYGTMWVGSADYVNYNPYICYVGQSTCDFAWLDHVLQVAESLGQPYFVALQAFKEGTEWRWPTAAEETQMLQRLCGTRAQGYLTFSWNWQNDRLLDHPAVLDAIKQFNLNGCGSTPPPTDTTPPSVPSGLTGTSTTTSIALSWQPSTDNVGVTGYDLYREGNKVGSASATTFTFENLTCGTSYALGVNAFDAAGNRSAQASLTKATSSCSSGGGGDPVIAAAGDLCGSSTDCAPTANLLGQIDPDRVLTLGDNAYPDGTLSDFNSFYDPNWGRYKAKTSPAPGNHDYHTAGGAGYFAYFGSQAPAPYYSFDLGSWHLISLNGEVSHSAGSAQETWLKADLAAHPAQCILAYWHEPRFSSGSVHGSNSSFDAFWRALYAAGADVVLNGHDHNYERFAPQSPSGAADAKGIREFIVGTGGRGLYSFSTPIANSEVRNATTHGVLKLTLHAGSYDWQFVPVAGSTFSDSGSGSCN